MNPTPVRRAPDDAVDVDVQVVPRASRSRLVGLHGDRLRIQLAAPPVDGAANQCLVELIAKLVGIPRSAVAITRGLTGKRKTLRLRGTTVEAVRGALDLDGGGGTDAGSGGRSRRHHGAPLLGRRALRFGLGALLPLASAAACESGEGPHLQVLLPEGDVDLESADNASLVLDPGGPSVTYDIDGPDFTLSLELELDDLQRTASLYIARGTDLLAWGRSAPFVLADTAAAVTIFVGRPGALSTFPGEVSGAEGMVAAQAPGRGMLLVAEDGGTYLLSERNLEISAGDAFPTTAPPVTASALVGERGGGVLRLSWAEGLAGWRFDPGLDSWETIELAGDLEVEPRDGAAWLVDASAEHLLLFGGGDQDDIVEIDLQPASEDGPYLHRRLEIALDGPRPGATPAWITRSGTDEGEGVLLFGGDQEDLPLASFTGVASPAGPLLRWTGAACEQVERGADASAGATLRVLCFGGLRDEVPTRDAAIIGIPPAGPLTVEVLAQWLPEAAAEPRLFSDESALYAQSAGSWLRFDPLDLSAAPDVSATTADRATGGHSVNLGTGVTFLVGGVTAEGQPVDRWQVFTPTPPAS